MERRANLLVTHKEAEVQLPDIPARVDKCVHMLLPQEVLQHPALRHEAEQVEVASKELQGPTKLSQKVYIGALTHHAATPNYTASQARESVQAADLHL